MKSRYILVMPDHVHLLVSLPSGMTDSKALHLLKVGSSYHILKNKDKCRPRYPQGHFWAADECAITLGYNDINTQINYIESQKEHHGLSSCYPKTPQFTVGRRSFICATISNSKNSTGLKKKFTKSGPKNKLKTI